MLSPLRLPHAITLPKSHPPSSAAPSIFSSVRSRALWASSRGVRESGSSRMLRLLSEQLSLQGFLSSCVCKLGADRGTRQSAANIPTQRRKGEYFLSFGAAQLVRGLLLESALFVPKRRKKLRCKCSPLSEVGSLPAYRALLWASHPRSQPRTLHTQLLFCVGMARSTATEEIFLLFCTW